MSDGSQPQATRWSRSRGQSVITPGRRPSPAQSVVCAELTAEVTMAWTSAASRVHGTTGLPNSNRSYLIPWTRACRLHICLQVGARDDQQSLVDSWRRSHSTTGQCATQRRHLPSPPQPKTRRAASGAASGRRGIASRRELAATNINRVVLTGNLTRDPELRTLPSGTSVCQLRVASNTRRKDASSGDWVDKPNYFDVTVWGAQGENCARYLTKGRPVAVDGHLEWREFETREGHKRQLVEIVAEHVQFLSAEPGGRGDRSAAPGTGEERPPHTDADIPF